MPVSSFRPHNGGVSPLSTTKWLKKGLSPFVPEWNSSTCIQCNLCSATCPHSVIRPFLISQEELDKFPPQLKDIKTLKAKGKEVKGFHYRIQISPYDCVGCQLCVGQCPTKSLKMKEIQSEDGTLFAVHQNDMFHYLNDFVEHKGELVKDKFTLKGSQFQKPLIEFPGSCEGCNETMVTKIVTQLFGPRMVIANTSGCSSVWGGASPRIPFTTDKNGRGPAWARSLFEDNAEFGYGMTIGLELRRAHLKDDVTLILQDKELINSLPSTLLSLLKEWDEKWLDGDATLKLEESLLCELGKNQHITKLNPIQGKKDLWVKPSNWIIGGDGWAYDIGYGGLDHIFSTGSNFNVLVFDNEVYSNTGGQQSKATNIGAIAQFASLGKDTPKKDLGFMMMNYGNVYVAQCAFGTPEHFNHLIKCLKEAESFNGPSLVLCYCNCILHHIKGAIGAGGPGGIKAQQLAVDSGYWPLYSYDPRREKEGKNPLLIESKKPELSKLQQFLDLEVRYSSLKKVNPKEVEEMTKKLHKQVAQRYRKYETFSQIFETSK